MVDFWEARDFALDKRKGDFLPDRLRNLSFIFTWIFVNLGVSANQATFIGMVSGVVGAAMLISTSVYSWAAGCLIFLLYLIMDCTDGEVADLNNNRTEFGGFFDELTHPITNSSLVLFSAIGAYRITGSLLVLVFGSLGSILFVLTSYLSFRLSFAGDSSSSGTGVRVGWRDIVYRPFFFVKELLFAPGGLLHPLLALVFVDLVFGRDLRIFYPVLASFAGLFLTLYKFRSIRASLD